ncbi:MAG: radical SAM protein [Anaerolineales bacterium]|nr:radical SAM protein [Anaerolineales bacterium]
MADIERLKLLTAQMSLEPAEDTGCPQLPPGREEDVHVGTARLPNGKQIKLLKTLLTSACERNCNYCPFRAGRDFRRATFKPEEFAATFLALHRTGAAEGLFISSGVVHGGMHTQDLLLDTADILRHKAGYTGYLHLKLMPGAERAQVEQAMRLADRVSINLEAPNTRRLADLAPRKQFLEELLQPLRWVEEIRRTQPAHLGWNGHWPSSVTQFVVGAVGENDLELLSTTAALYRQLRLRRAYFSAFSPIEDTPLENTPPSSPLRSARLYEASFLLRDYGFTLEDLPFEPDGSLPQHTDPKLAWARLHLAEHPVEINRASREQLLKVPGIGPRSAIVILAARRQQRILHLEDLRKLGIRTSRAAPYLLLNGFRPAYQKALW